jgi:Ni,Fe-hydrogenase III large subunit
MLRQASLRDVATDVAALRRLLERARALDFATANVGVISRESVAGRGLGPVARAAGLAEDARAHEAQYRAIGFEPVNQGACRLDASGDARDRWQQRLAEIVQSLDLASRAGDRRIGGDNVPIEGPCGTLRGDAGGTSPNAALLQLLPDLLHGCEWGDAVTTIVSLDLDPRNA